MSDIIIPTSLHRGALVLLCSSLLLTGDAAGAAPSPKRTQPAPRKPPPPPADPGVDTGIVNAPTALFTEPSVSAPRIGPLGKGDLTVLVSRTPESGWLKVVQFSSGRQGWVKAERLIVRYTKRPAPGVDLRGALLGTADLPALLVRNDSNKVLFLHLGATPEIEIPPQSTKKVTVPAGAYAYNVASPGSYPGFGSTAFVTGSEYVMTFYIRPKTGVQRAASPALMAEFNKLQAEVDTADAEVDFQKKQIDTDRASLTVQRDAWDRRSEDLEARRQKLDRTDQAAVDEFNRLVEAVNADLKSLEEAEKRFEALVALHNTKVDTVNAARKRLQGLGDKINATQ